MFIEAPSSIQEIFQAIREYAVWELLGGAGAFLFRGFMKQATTSKDTDKATRESSMSLSPDGWESIDQKRFENSDPIQPR